MKSTLIAFINVLYNLVTVAIFVRIVLSWFRTNPSNPLYRFFDDVTRPILGLARRITPPIGMFDFSPVVALIALQVLYYLITGLLAG